MYDSYCHNSDFYNAPGKRSPTWLHHHKSMTFCDPSPGCFLREMGSPSSRATHLMDSRAHPALRSPSLDTLHQFRSTAGQSSGNVVASLTSTSLSPFTEIPIHEDMHALRSTPPAPNRVPPQVMYGAPSPLSSSSTEAGIRFRPYTPSAHLSPQAEHLFRAAVGARETQSMALASTVLKPDDLGRRNIVDPEERRQWLENDPATGTVAPEYVVCGGCGKRIMTDSRSKKNRGLSAPMERGHCMYYPGAWKKHRKSCKKVKVLLESRGEDPNQYWAFYGRAENRNREGSKRRSLSSASQEILSIDSYDSDDGESEWSSGTSPIANHEFPYSDTMAMAGTSRQQKAGGNVNRMSISALLNDT